MLVTFMLDGSPSHGQRSRSSGKDAVPETRSSAVAAHEFALRLVNGVEA
jgi:hypothetical protein